PALVVLCLNDRGTTYFFPDEEARCSERKRGHLHRIEAISNAIFPTDRYILREQRPHRILPAGIQPAFRNTVVRPDVADAAAHSYRQCAVMQIAEGVYR